MMAAEVFGPYYHLALLMLKCKMKWSFLYPLLDTSQLDSFWGFYFSALDKIIPHLHILKREELRRNGDKLYGETILLVLAIALHNIPEGLAVGVLWKL